MLRKIMTIIALCVVVPPVAVFALALVLRPGNAMVGVSQDYKASAMLATPLAAWKEPITLRVGTFNIQDLYVVAVNHENRMRAIPKKLKELDPDLMGFQEAFVDKHRAILIDGLKANTRLQHFQYYPSGTIGSGVLIASAFPIQDVCFLRYAASNPWWKIWEGDWWGGKGAGLARIALPGGRILDFYSTHAQAGYGNPAYVGVRKDQMTELAGFVKGSHAGTVPAILTGDLNCAIGRPDFQAVADACGLKSLLNQDSRIDHVLGASDPHYTFEILDTIKIDKRSTVDGQPIDLTDHNGWVSVVKITPVA